MDLWFTITGLRGAGGGKKPTCFAAQTRDLIGQKCCNELPRKIRLGSDGVNISRNHHLCKETFNKIGGKQKGKAVGIIRNLPEGQELRGCEKTNGRLVDPNKVTTHFIKTSCETMSWHNRGATRSKTAGVKTREHLIEDGGGNYPGHSLICKKHTGNLLGGGGGA